MPLGYYAEESTSAANHMRAADPNCGLIVVSACASLRAGINTLAEEATAGFTGISPRRNQNTTTEDGDMNVNGDSPE